MGLLPAFIAYGHRQGIFPWVDKPNLRLWGTGVRAIDINKAAIRGWIAGRIAMPNFPGILHITTVGHIDKSIRKVVDRHFQWGTARQGGAGEVGLWGGLYADEAGGGVWATVIGNN